MAYISQCSKSSVEESEVEPVVFDVSTGRRPDGFKATVKLRCLPSSGRPGAGSHGPGDTATDLPSTSTETVTQDTSNSKHANAGEILCP